MAHESEHKKLSDDPVVRGHETSDADAKSVALSGIALSVGLMIGGILLSWGVYRLFQSYSPTPSAPTETFVVPDSAKLPGVPRLQQDPHVLLVPFVKAQDSVLESYSWVNEDSGIARIPIERAMELVVKQGLPVQSVK